MAGKNIQILRNGQFHELNLPNLIEELEGLVKSEKNALKSNLSILLIHLLKCRYQPEIRPRSRDGTIAEHRDRIEYSLEDSPSLKGYLEEVFGKCYQKARKRASIETGISVEQFPKETPFSVAEVLSENFFRLKSYQICSKNVFVNSSKNGGTMLYIKKLLHTFLKQWQLTEQIPSQLLEELENVLTLVEDYSLLLAFSKSAGLKARR